MRWILPVVIVNLATATATRAAAEGQQVSVTWSPIHLVFPIVELEGEFRVAPKIGVGVIGGAGRVSSEDGSVTATAYEVGGQFNYYVMAPFSGLHGGLEVVYLHLGDVAQDLTTTAAGLAIGPYAGYKVLTKIGFTFVAQLGVQYAAYKAESSASSQSVSDKKVFPLLNLNVGWSF